MSTCDELITLDGFFFPFIAPCKVKSRFKRRSWKVSYRHLFPVCHMLDVIQNPLGVFHLLRLPGSFHWGKQFMKFYVVPPQTLDSAISKWLFLSFS